MLKENKSLISLAGFSTEELFDILSGDLVIAFKDLSLQENAINLEAVLGLGINNKANLDKLLGNLDGLPFFKKKSDHYLISLYGTDIYLIEKNKTIFITLSENIKSNFAKGSDKIESKFVSMAKSSASVVFMDIPKTITPFFAIGESFEADDEVKLIKDIVKEFGIMEAKSSFKSAYSETEGFMTMTNKNRNSFAVLIDIFKKIAEENAKQEEKRKKEREKFEKEMEKLGSDEPNVEESFDDAEVVSPEEEQ
jgi:hypothetical protein